MSYRFPKERHATFDAYQGAVQPKIETKDKYNYYSWEKANLAGYDFEDYIPSWYTLYQWIECSEFKSWKQVGERTKNVNPIHPIHSDSALKKYVNNAWQESKGDENEYFRLVSDFFQNEVRHMVVEMGEYSHRANNPHKVFDQPYGDCKYMSVLLAANLLDKT